jgi:hypothetical protein
MPTLRNVLLLIPVSAVCLALLPAGHCQADEKSRNDATPAMEPIEQDMHEFMEYVFEPTYKRLKAALAEQPQDAKIWKSIKSDALILAEGGNLLLLRRPQKDVEAWQQHALEVGQFGGQLYRAGKTKDYESVMTKYTAMLEKCNRCHQQFANGKHQLTP